MTLKTFCEMASKTLIPSLRALIAITMIEKYNMTQVEVAKLLGITQPAISYYMHSKRGRRAIDFLRNNKKIMKMVEEFIDKIHHGVNRETVYEGFCKLCRSIRNDPELVKEIEEKLFKQSR